MEKPHKRLEVWKLAMEIVEDIYRITETFPSSERFGLIPHLRKTVISIPSNIAEGAGRNTKKEFVNFLHIAQGSLSELDTQMELSKQIGCVSEDEWKRFDDKITREDKMLSGLIKSLKVRVG